MKIFSNNQIKKITKGSLALVLASTFTFSSIAFANEDTTEEATYETVNLQEVQSQLESTQTEAPSLIPGDFFYFAKIALEKIKLAVTFDNAKEAELMATYASERLAEAGALYGEGKEAEALEVIQAAIEYMENSQNIVDEETDAEEVASDDQNTNGDSIEEEAVTEEDDAETTEPTSNEESSEEQDSYTEVENTLRNNISALKAAMEHVGSDQARDSLQKNIDKTYAKIEKKLAKLEKKYGTAEEEGQVTDETTDLETVNAPETTEENTETVTTEPSETVVDSAETVTVPNTVSTEETGKGNAKAVEKEHGKQQAKAEVKEQGKGNSAQAKQKESKGNKEGK